MTSTLNIQAANGVPFTVVYIPAGVAGPNPHRTPATNTKSTAEFYDARYYYVGALLGTDGYGSGTGGICLHGGNPSSWSLDAASMETVRAWLRDLERGFLSKAEATALQTALDVLA